MLPPMVMMTRPRGVADLRGLMASRSNTMPTTVVRRMAPGIAAAKGRPAAPRSDRVNIPPSMTNSPWAKLMMPVAL